MRSEARLWILSLILIATGVAMTAGLVRTPGGLHDRFCGAVHDSYRVTGPDGRSYATWHPPSVEVFGVVTCHFGHEHGDDPRTSLANPTLPPFDYVNGLTGRSEPHAGFKVFVVNDDGRGGRFRMVVHQGSTTENAFHENRHELFVDYVNADGRELHTMLIGHFGPSGKFKTGCEGDAQLVTIAAPANGFTDGERIIPDAGCLAEGRLPYEIWGASQIIRDASGRALASYKPYFTILNPNRVFRPGAPGALARSDAETGGSALPEGTSSRFKGTQREVYEGSFAFDNAQGSTKIWTDADGNVQSGPCPTCIQQFICSVTSITKQPTVVFRTAADYDDGSIHAPN